MIILLCFLMDLKTQDHIIIYVGVYIYTKTKYDCYQKAYFDEFKIASVLHAFFSISNSCESLWRLN